MPGRRLEGTARKARKPRHAGLAFFGALSDVEYTVRVSDLESGQERTYVNPQGRLASVADTDAFP
jgi:hypothetical protein